MKNLNDELLTQIHQLRICIDNVIRYINDDDSIVVNRLRSYYDAIQKCIDYVHEIEKLIDTNRDEDIYSYLNKIIMISHLIKNDAMNVLLMTETGFDDAPETFIWN